MLAHLTQQRDEVEHPAVIGEDPGSEPPGAIQLCGGSNSLNKHRAQPTILPAVLHDESHLGGTGLATGS